MIYLIIKKNKDFRYFIKFKKTNFNNNLIPIFLKKNFFKLNKKLKNEEVYEILKSKELMNVKKNILKKNCLIFLKKSSILR